MNIPYSPANTPPIDSVMSVPVHVDPLFDFSDWQATHPTQPLPGTNVDAEFVNGYTAINNIIDRLAMIQRDDGALANASVGFDQMDPAILAAIDADVADAAAAAAAAEAAQAAAEASQAAAEAALAEATAATDAAEAAQAAAAASAAEAAASVDQVIPLVEDAQQAATDAAAAAAAVEGLIPDLPATPDDVITVNAAGTDYELRRALVLLGGDHFNAGGYPIENVALPTNDNDAANKAFVIASISAAGSVPAPAPTDDGKVLTVTGGGLFGWAAFLVAQISDATAFMKGLLTGVNDQAGLLAAAGAAPAAEGTPVPANPGDNGKVLTANAGAKVWTALAAAPGQATEATLGLVRIVDAATIDAGADDQEAVTAKKLNDSKYSVIGKHEIPIRANGMVAHGGAYTPQFQTLTPLHYSVRVYSFDQAQLEIVDFDFTLPKSWDRGPITFDICWWASAGAVGAGVYWTLEAMASGDGETLGAVGVAVGVVDTVTALNTQQISAVSANVTVLAAAGALAPGDHCYFRLSRNPANAGDTLAADAHLEEIRLYVNTTKGNDA